MNPLYFGDSYDIVKRFFCEALAALGYAVVADPMFTGNWNGGEDGFLRFIGARAATDARESGRTALFVDPDTGVHLRASRSHVSLAMLAERTAEHALVFAFDQSFSRRRTEADAALRGKLDFCRARGCDAMYYDSHARFLFVSRSATALPALRTHLESLGLPPARFVAGDAC